MVALSDSCIAALARRADIPDKQSRHISLHLYFILIPIFIGIEIKYLARRFLSALFYWIPYSMM